VADHGGLEASSDVAGQGTASGQVTYRLVGAERDYAIAGRGLPAESLQVRPPRWAKRMEIDLDLPPELWDELTDFSVTIYDSTGEQVRGGNEPMNYPFGRMSLALSDSLRGVPLTVELYPAYARLPAHPWHGEARVRFLGPDEPVSDGGVLSVVAGGRTVLKLPNAPALNAPPGFGPLLETRVTTPTGSVAARRIVVGLR